MSAGQAQPGSGDNSLDFLWLVVIIVGAIVGIWYFGKPYIVPVVFQIRLYEVAAIKFFLTGWSQLMTWLHLPFLIPDISDLTQASKVMQASKNQADLQTVTDISNSVGRYLRYPLIILMLFLAFTLYSSNAILRFKNVFNMKRLKLAEIENWPQITPVAQLDLVNQDIDKGPWAMAKTPMQYCKEHGLLREETKDGRPSVSLIHGNAHRIFALQLGPLWIVPEKLPIYTQALLAIFAARTNRDRDGADKLLKQIAASAKDINVKHLDFTGTRELLAKNLNNKEVGRAIGPHAYILTVMASMLEAARNDGVLASSEFLWLKPIDRRLWYMLNTVGRRTPVSEIAGAYAHWLAEKKLGRPLRVPMVDEAVKAMDLALQEIIYEPDEQ